jgi:hypothetical protein
MRDLKKILNRAFMYLIYTRCDSYFYVPLNYSCRAQSASCNSTKNSEYLINFREIFEKSKIKIFKSTAYWDMMQRYKEQCTSSSA